MKRQQVCIASFWVCLGFFVFVYAIHLGIGSLLKPGSGLFPFGLGLLIFFLASYKLITEFTSKGSEDEPTDGQTNASLPFGRLIALVISLFAYALLLEPLGYIIATFFGMMALFRIAGYRNLLSILLYAACVTAVTYFGFTYLGTIFPPGLLRYLGMH